MVIKVYISGISASKEIKKRQQRALLILDSCKVDYEPIDITEPGLEAMREFMVQNSKIREPNKTPLSPQFFNDDVYCGDFEDFDSAVEINEVFPFLKLECSGNDFQYHFNNVNTKTTNGDHGKDDTRKSITPEGEENEEGEVIKESDGKGDGDGEEEGEEEEEEEEEDGEFWAQDDSKKRKKNDDGVEEESKESNEEEIESEDASKRLKTDGKDEVGEEEEEEEEDEVEAEKPEVESEKIEGKKDEDDAEVEEEEEDSFWAGKGD